MMSSKSQVKGDGIQSVDEVRPNSNHVVSQQKLTDESIETIFEGEYLPVDISVGQYGDESKTYSNEEERREVRAPTVIEKAYANVIGVNNVLSSMPDNLSSASKIVIETATPSESENGGSECENEINRTNSVVRRGIRLLKQSSLPETYHSNGATCEINMQKENSFNEGKFKVSHSWTSYQSSGITLTPFLSPYGSSTTLTGSMYTASEGWKSLSGMVSIPESGDVFVTPSVSGDAFAADVRNQDDKNWSFSSCHSHLDLGLENREHERENAINEEKLRDLKSCVNTNLKNSSVKESAKDSMKKMFRGIQKRNSSKDKKTGWKNGKDKSVEIIVQADYQDGMLSNHSTVVPKAIRRTKSNESASSLSKTYLGGARAILVEKVRF